jgi:hypothetical protein
VCQGPCLPGRRGQAMSAGVCAYMLCAILACRTTSLLGALLQCLAFTSHKVILRSQASSFGCIPSAFCSRQHAGRLIICTGCPADVVDTCSWGYAAGGIGISIGGQHHTDRPPVHDSWQCVQPAVVSTAVGTLRSGTCFSQTLSKLPQMVPMLCCHLLLSPLFSSNR